MDWDGVIDSQLNEMNRMRDAMRQNDVQSIGEIRKFYLGGILEKISAYISN
jgi:hypothetical protein